MTKKLRCAFLFFFVLLNLKGFAQNATADSLTNDVMQTDSSDADEQDPDFLVANVDQDSTQKFHFRVAFDGMASTGNIERFLLQTSAALDYKPSKFLKMSMSPSFLYGSQSGILYEREFFDDLRLTLGYSNRLYGTAFSSWERSNLRQIRNRWVQAAGLGYKLVQRPKTYISITNLILHENTDFAERTDLDLWRNSTRLLCEFAPTNKLKVLSTLLYQPSFSDKGNIRWSGVVSVQYRVGKGISFFSKFENVYESYVVSNRKNNDFRATAGLAFEH